jgi:NADH-quinone oxidoreductase subunit A
MPILLAYILLFAAVGFAFILVNLLVGKLLRPVKPDAEKATIYECGEPTVGTSWVQFDLRYYVVALLFVIFDVEVAFFFPWGVVYGKLNALADPRISDADRTVVKQALIPEHARRGGVASSAESDREQANTLAWFAAGDILVFFGILLVGFAYLWKRGDLNWVKSTAAELEDEAEAAA